MQTWKKNFALLFALLFALSPLSACGGGEGVTSSSSSSEYGETPSPENSKKTQLRVSFTNAGFGDGWTSVLERGFEKKMQNRSFESGRRGVDVIFEVGSADVTEMQVATGDFDVYFMENPNNVVPLMTSGVLQPLNTLLTTPNPDDGGQKIVDKLYEPHKTAYSYKGEQYLLPHYIGAYGIVYNIDLFEENGFYFAETPDLENELYLIDKTRTEKSAGPDGKKGTYDDGLPTTYDEFFYLCREINAVGVNPVSFTGKYSAWHLEYLMDALVISYEGKDEGALNYTFDGTASELVVFDEDGSIQRENGKIVTETAEITPETGYETARHISKYYAMQFVKTLFGDETYYNEDDGKDEEVTYTDMQEGFLDAQKSLSQKESAMIVDGTWWQREATAVFDRMAKEDESCSKMNRRFGWLPLPQPTQEKADEIKNGERKTAFGDQINGVVCVKGNLLASKQQVALEFIKYAYSDEALTAFTYEVGATIGVDYFDALDDAKTTPYIKNYVAHLQSSDIVYPVSTEARFAQNRTAYRAHTKYKSKAYVDITQAFMYDGVTAEEFFADYQGKFKSIAWG